MRNGLVSFALAAALLACGPTTSSGVGFLRVAELSGACPVTFETSGDPVIPLPDEYKRVHANVAFQKSARWPGGSLVVTSWKEADGTVKRLYVEVDPARGYGASKTPSPVWNQGIGYIEWKDGARVFGATHADGFILNDRTEKSEHIVTGLKAPPGLPPGVFFAQLAVSATDQSGATICKLVALHAEPDEPRELAYDPQWMKPNPSVMIIDGTSPSAPTFADDLAPGNNVVPAASAPLDPAGTPPRMNVGLANLDHREGVSSGCD